MIGDFNAISNLSYGSWVIVDDTFYIMIIMKAGMYPVVKYPVAQVDIKAWLIGERHMHVSSAPSLRGRFIEEQHMRRIPSDSSWRQRGLLKNTYPEYIPIDPSCR